MARPSNTNNPTPSPVTLGNPSSMDCKPNTVITTNIIATTLHHPIIFTSILQCLSMTITKAATIPTHNPNLTYPKAISPITTINMYPHVS